MRRERAASTLEEFAAAARLPCCADKGAAQEAQPLETVAKESCLAAPACVFEVKLRALHFFPLLLLVVGENR